MTNALWGGVNWGRRDVNINVNRWNNINVNHRITSNNRNVNWNHNPGNRRGVPYRDLNTRNRMQQINAGELGSRQEYRGREDQRAQARAALSDRVGAENLDRDALRNIDRNQIPQRVPEGAGASARDRAAAIDRSQVQDRAANIDRSQVQERAANIDRSQVQDRAANVDRSRVQDRASNIDRSQVQQRTANIDRSQVQDRAANIDRSQVQNRNESAARINRDNALRGANDGRQTQQQIDRGLASQAAQRQSNVSRRRCAAAQRQNARSANPMFRALQVVLPPSGSIDNEGADHERSNDEQSMVEGHSRADLRTGNVSVVCGRRDAKGFRHAGNCGGSPGG